MKLIYHKYSTLIIVLICMLLSACKKTVTQPVEDLAKVIFEQNILNKDFVVKKFINKDSVDLTAQFEGDTFTLIKNTYQDGPLKARKNGIEYSGGTWACTEDYGKLTITLPSTVPEFSLLVKDWRFVSKDIPVMELAPWLEPKTSPSRLQMERVE